MLTLRWLKKMGGVAGVEKLNNEKANLLYSAMQKLPLFKPKVAKEDRSKMNAVFTIEDPEIEKQFLDLCKKENMYGVKGHRIVGGFRVSLYNALPLSSVKAFTELMEDFAGKFSYQNIP